MSLRRNRAPFIIISPPMMFVGTPRSDDREPQAERLVEEPAEHRAAEAADTEDHCHADRGALGAQVVRVRGREQRADHRELRGQDHAADRREHCEQPRGSASPSAPRSAHPPG